MYTSSLSISIVGFLFFFLSHLFLFEELLNNVKTLLPLHSFSFLIETPGHHSRAVSVQNRVLFRCFFYLPPVLSFQKICSSILLKRSIKTDLKKKNYMEKLTTCVESSAWHHYFTDFIQEHFPDEASLWVRQNIISQQLV